jgi:phage-related protein
MAEGQDLKPVEWVGSSLDDLRNFPEQVQDEIGFALYQAPPEELDLVERRLKAAAAHYEEHYEAQGNQD